MSLEQLNVSSEKKVSQNEGLPKPEWKPGKAEKKIFGEKNSSKVLEDILAEFEEGQNPHDLKMAHKLLKGISTDAISKLDPAKRRLIQKNISAEDLAGRSDEEVRKIFSLAKEDGSRIYHFEKNKDGLNEVFKRTGFFDARESSIQALISDGKWETYFLRFVNGSYEYRDEYFRPLVLKDEIRVRKNESGKLSDSVGELSVPDTTAIARALFLKVSPEVKDWETPKTKGDWILDVFGETVKKSSVVVRVLRSLRFLSSEKEQSVSPIVTSEHPHAVAEKERKKNADVQKLLFDETKNSLAKLQTYFAKQSNGDFRSEVAEAAQHWILNLEKGIQKSGKSGNEKSGNALVSESKEGTSVNE